MSGRPPTLRPFIGITTLRLAMPPRRAGVDMPHGLRIRARANKFAHGTRRYAWSCQTTYGPTAKSFMFPAGGHTEPYMRFAGRLPWNPFFPAGFSELVGHQNPNALEQALFVCSGDCFTIPVSLSLLNATPERYVLYPQQHWSRIYGAGDAGLDAACGLRPLISPWK